MDVLTELCLCHHIVTNNFSSLADFPLFYQSGFQIIPGHLNMMALTATKLTSSEDIRRLTPIERNCLFPNENHGMQLHKNYSQANCLLECQLFYAQKLLTIKSTKPMCTPRYYPFQDAGHRVCDPWETESIVSFMSNQVPPNECKYCLPGCNRIIYQKSVTFQPFRKCDETNFGMSDFCTFELLNTIPGPQMWGKLAQEKMKNMSIQDSSLQDKIVSSYRMSTGNVEYDAFEKDIAMLKVFFESPTAVLITTKQTWIDFVSAVGGNGGLFIGFSLVTILELIWLILQIILLYLKISR